MILKFPNSQEVDVIYDDTAHSYNVAHKLANGEFSDYRPTHGITASLDVIPHEYLKPWAGKMSVKATLEAVAKEPGIVDQLPQFFIDIEDYENKTRTPDGKPVMSYYKFKKQYPWYSGLSTAFKSDTGKEIGTWLHAAIEAFYNSNRKQLPILTPDVEPIWGSFQTFDNYYKPNTDATEFFVYSLMFGYSGQGDWRGIINGKYCILDWKSSNRSDFNPVGISIENFYQVGGLAQAEFERTGDWPEDLGIVNLDKKGEEAKVLFASEFGMSPQDAARAYISCFNNHHMHETWDYRFKKR